MDSKARYDTFSNNNNLEKKPIVIAGDSNIDYNKPSTVLETYKEVLDTYNLKQHVKKPTRQSVKTTVTLLATSKLKKSS